MSKKNDKSFLQTESNHFNNVFSFAFNKEFLLESGKYSIYSNFKKQDELLQLLFEMNDLWKMDKNFSVKQLRTSTKQMRKSFEKITKIQLNKIKNQIPSFLEKTADRGVYQIPLGEIPRLIGVFVKSCFHIIAYDVKHVLFPTAK